MAFVFFSCASAALSSAAAPLTRYFAAAGSPTTLLRATHASMQIQPGFRGQSPNEYPPGYGRRGYGPPGYGPPGYGPPGYGPPESSREPPSRQHESPYTAPSVVHPSVIPGLAAAWVLIFNAGQANEGVYTLERGAPAVLAFETTADADDFAQSLSNEGFDLASACRWDANQLTEFCSSGGYGVELVPPGMNPTPPATNEYRPGTGSAHDPQIALRMQLEALVQKPDNCGDDDCTMTD